MDKTSIRSMPEIVFREATIADREGIKAIYNYYIEYTEASWRYAPVDDLYIANWINKHSGGRRPAYVAEIDKKIVGYSSLSDFRQGEGYWPCAENSIYILPEYTGKGIGQELMRLIIEQGRSSGLKSIIAVIDSDNESSITFHESFGFHRCGMLKDIGWKNNHSLSSVYLQLDLDHP
jgi:L-amino acid N-acyltransferase YncA